MSLGIAEYIAIGASGGCLTEVIDRYSSNPSHTPCIEVGGCENRVKRRGTEEPDPHRKDREEARSLPNVHKKDDELVHKATRASAPIFRPTAERKHLLEALLAWRAQKLREILLVHDYSLEAIITQKEAERIAKNRGITHANDFDKAGVN
ncbi:hypothetical protein RhiLY_11562 [Ceratobasidium sp. AG-Ba]|nr:hypothetical protein RhiLY_11562 [Ceratobasidium sp. AG-Ba]